MNRRRLLQLLSTTSLTVGAGAIAPAPVYSAPVPSWGYTGKNAPKFWGQISPSFEPCRTGVSQSPINLSQFEPSRSQLEIHYADTSLRLINTGRTIQINYEPGSFILLNGTLFSLLQFHFHHPSEHRVQGQQFDMELHVLHRSDAGDLAVISVLLMAGAVNATLQPIWAALPEVLGIEQTPSHALRDGKAEQPINARALLPDDTRFVEYSGSLTTPPCTEGVQWLVMMQPVTLSTEQIQHFATLFPLNARPVQRG